MALVQNLQLWFLDLFFPRRCVVCHEEGAWLCEECEKKVPAELHRFALGQSEAKALFSFHTPAIRELLHHLKYNGVYEAAAVLVKLAGQFGLLKELDVKSNQVLVPVPTSRAHVKQRGYNQAEELAKALGVRLGLPVHNRILARKGGGHSQVGKTAQERGLLENEFYVLPGDYRDYSIILVDDVSTTGSTLRRVEALLRTAGCTSVEIVVMARK